MLVQADCVQRAGWALKDTATGLLILSDVCDTEREALLLRRQQTLHQPHRGELEVVPVLITVTEVPR